jgi:hypothetical protein
MINTLLSLRAQRGNLIIRGNHFEIASSLRSSQ